MIDLDVDGRYKGRLEPCRGIFRSVDIWDISQGG